MITNIDIDEAVVAEAMRLTGARSKRELVDRALRELVARASRPSVRELFGIGGVDPDYDPKAVPGSGARVGQYRVEQPTATYTIKERAASSRKQELPSPKRTGRKRPER